MRGGRSGARSAVAIPCHTRLRRPRRCALPVDRGLPADRLPRRGEETQMHTELEMGAISSPSEHRPEGGEWAGKALQRARLRGGTDL